MILSPVEFDYILEESMWCVQFRYYL